MKETLILEFDGGSRGNPGPAGIGVVVRAQDGTPLVTLGRFIGRATNNVAEYHGLIAGLESVISLNPEARVEVRMDSKLVVEQMSGRWKIKHPDMRDLALRASKLLPAARVQYSWVPRADNFRADALVNEALDAAIGGILDPIHRRFGALG